MTSALKRRSNSSRHLRREISGIFCTAATRSSSDERTNPVTPSRRIWHRAARSGNDRSAGSQWLDHHKSERLGDSRPGDYDLSKDRGRYPSDGIMDNRFSRPARVPSWRRHLHRYRSRKQRSSGAARAQSGDREKNHAVHVDLAGFHRKRSIALLSAQSGGAPTGQNSERESV